MSGEILRVLFAGRLPVPILVDKGYVLPAFCHDRTLVFAVSFSGNTEETLAAYGEGVARSCRMVALSSGGELAAFAAVVLRHAGEDPRIQARVEATLSAVAPSGLEGRQVHARGSSPAERLFSLIMLGDFASVYVALLRGIDPTPVPVLTGLKARLRR